MKQIWNRTVLYGSFLLLLTACGQAVAPALPDEPSAPQDVTPPVIETQSELKTAPPQQESEMTPSTPSSSMGVLIEQAREDLAQHLSIPLSQISTVEAREVSWPDTSLGCPQAGMSYAQVVTPGYQIVLKANSQVFLYHTDFTENLILCENPELPVFPVTPGEIDDGQPWMPVD